MFCSHLFGLVVSFNCAIFLSAVFFAEQLVAAKTKSLLGGNLGNFFEVTDYVSGELHRGGGEEGRVMSQLQSITQK